MYLEILHSHNYLYVHETIHVLTSLNAFSVGICKKKRKTQF